MTNAQLEEIMGINMRVFSYKYLGATDTKPSRIAIYDKRFNKRKIVSWDHLYNTAAKNAAAYLVSLGYEILGSNEDENVIICKGWNITPIA
jgi:hypothetical protein